jgi:alkaline phosphatase D
MKIIFCSCLDAVDDRDQAIWNSVRKLSPDVLLLLGDTVYMDFGLGLLGSNRPLGWPRKATNEAFATALYDRYRRQWAVLSFQTLLSSGVKVGLTWDDHDFAWNNSRGAGNEKHYAVSREKRLISRSLFLQFREAIRPPLSDHYPQIPEMHTLLNADDVGIQDTFDVGNIRFIMLDGRSFRQDPNITPDAEMHGAAQRTWLSELLAWNGPKIICSGSVLTHSKESWDQYVDYVWMLDQPASDVIVVTGDIHKNSGPVRHREDPALYEITSSGMARPGLGGGRGNYGCLTIDDEIYVDLYSREVPTGSRFPLSF